MDLLLATSNPGKVEELTRLLAPLDVTLRTLAEFPDIPDVSENEPTFEANAEAKARHYVERTNIPAIADDGGLEIDALDGWPGVHSRRIFGDGRRATDEEMISEVLRRMTDIPLALRGCQMRTVVAFAAPDRAEFHTEGIARGVIVEEPAAHRIPGYPFNSLFMRAGATAVGSMGHRRAAITKLLPLLQEWLAVHRYA